MIEVAVTAEIEEEAWDRASDMPFLSGSITNGTSNVVGCLGEILVQRHLHAKFSNTFNYDLIDGERRIDVKTKDVTQSRCPFMIVLLLLMVVIKNVMIMCLCEC